MILALQGQRTGPLVINSVPVQQQIGGSDCGVFAVAYLIELLHSHDQSKSRLKVYSKTIAKPYAAVFRIRVLEAIPQGRWRK